MSVNGVISGVVRPVVRSPILFKGVGGNVLRSPITNQIMLSPVTGQPMTSPVAS